MMDFLRRLAPPRETDATRAVAVLPSRYAMEDPIRDTAAHARSAQRSEDDEAPPSVGTPSASARQYGLGGETQVFRVPYRATNTQVPANAALRPAGSGKQLPQITPRPFGPPGALDDQTMRWDIGKTVFSTLVPAREHNTDAADPLPSQDQDGANSTHPAPFAVDLRSPAKAQDGNHSPRSDVGSPARPTSALPLSQGALAQRAHNAREDNQVVHVTIGRIDVVANTAPTPPPRRDRAPRQATVTLADYLRGAKGALE